MVDREKINKLTKDWRVRVYLIFLVLLGIIPLLLIGLKFGIDFSGGSMIYLRLEHPVSEGKMETVVLTLQSRLNEFGLKDMSVRPVGDQYVLVSLSGMSNTSLESVKDILSKQGVFEGIIDGKIALTSETNDIMQVRLDRQSGYGWSPTLRQWQIPFDLSGPAAKRFAEVAEGKCQPTEEGVKCEKIYMFIDRPKDSAIIVPSDIAEKEKYMYIVPENPSSSYITIDDLKKNSNLSFIFADDLNESVIERIKENNITRVIIPAGFNYSKDLANKDNITVVERAKTSEYWLWSATGLKSVLSLTQGVTSGTPVERAVIQGYAETQDEAEKEMARIVVILKSGQLPVKLNIATTMQLSPTLGEQFLNYAILIGILAWLAVGLVVFVRYRDPKLSGFIMANNLSEVIIILGVASLINWEIDLAAMAGIVAAVGTGVDHMIVISDEVLAGGRRKEEVSALTKIKKAFEIIFAAALTTGAAMLPLITLGLGMMKGFAITTLIGVVIGVLIVRPAFARIIEEMI